MSDNKLLSAFPALEREDAKVLILGSMPGVASLDAQRYYAHPRNAFWPVMHDCFLKDGKAQENYADRVALVLDNQVAVWDVLKHCARPGSLDSAIDKKSVVLNDFGTFISGHKQLRHILFNGKTAEKLFRQKALPTLAASVITTVQLHVMPSTSPAMATLSLQEKTALWTATLRQCLEPTSPAG